MVNKAIEAAAIALCWAGFSDDFQNDTDLTPEGYWELVCAVKQDAYRAEARAIIAAFLAAEPEWQLVPVNPTEQMIDGALPTLECSNRFSGGGVVGDVVDVYNAMLAAAPKYPLDDVK